MLKSQLIEELAAKFNHHSVQEVTNCVKIIMKSLTASLSQGERIEIRGFGTFALRHHAPRSAHIPNTGKRLITSAKYIPHFKPGKKLRARVDK